MVPDPLRGVLRYPENFDLAKEYLDAGCKINAYHIIDAIELHSIDTVGWLLKNGADPNEKIDEKSVLSVAMEIYCKAMDSFDITKLTLTYYTKKSIKKLLKYGAIPTIEEIRTAVLTHDGDIFRRCLAANRGIVVDMDLLCMAIENSDLTGYTVLETLLQLEPVRRMLCETIEGYGHPLAFALVNAPKRNLTVRILLENGASPNSINASGRSVLEVAYQANMMHVVLLLLSAGATLDTDVRRGILMERGVESIDLIDDLKAFLMLRQAIQSPISPFTQLPSDILYELTNLIMQSSIQAYFKHQ